MPGEVRWSITQSDRPTGQHRARLVARADLLRSFPAAPEDFRKAMISRLFLRFPTMAKATEQQVTSYALDIAPFPMWAIAKGLSDIVAGLVLRVSEFPPTSLQVREAVERAASGVRDELAAIDGLLGATVIPDDAARPDTARRRELAATARQAMLGPVAPLEKQQPHPWIEARDAKRRAVAADVASRPAVASDALLAALGRVRAP